MPRMACVHLCKMPRHAVMYVSSVLQAQAKVQLQEQKVRWLRCSSAVLMLLQWVVLSPRRCQGLVTVTTYAS